MVSQMRFKESVLMDFRLDDRFYVHCIIVPRNRFSEVRYVYKIPTANPCRLCAPDNAYSIKKEYFVSLCCNDMQHLTFTWTCTRAMKALNWVLDPSGSRTLIPASATCAACAELA